MQIRILLVHGVVPQADTAHVFGHVDHLMNLEGDVTARFVLDFAALVEQVQVVLLATSAFETIHVVVLQSIFHHRNYLVLDGGN